MRTWMIRHKYWSYVWICGKSFLFACFMFQVKVVSPKHRLIKVDSQEFGRCKIPLSPVTVQEEPVSSVFKLLSHTNSCSSSLTSCRWVHFVIFLIKYLLKSLCPRWFLQPQQWQTWIQTILTHLMPDQTLESNQTGSPNLHHQTAAATWSHSRPSGSSQVLHLSFVCRALNEFFALILPTIQSSSILAIVNLHKFETLFEKCKTIAFNLGEYSISYQTLKLERYFHINAQQ